MRYWLGLCGLLVCLGIAQAQTATTTGPLTLLPTFDAVSVTAAFTGDTDANNSAVVHYRVTGTPVWHEAYTPYMDRRMVIGTTSNPYAMQARVSLVGLSSNTRYDVRVTWTDADGVVGTNPVTRTISTLTPSPPRGGSTLTVTNNATLASALRSVNAGQTIHLNAGTYSPFTISRSGNATAWIVLEGDASGGTIITGAGVSQNVVISANFVIVQHLTLSASDRSGILVAANTHHVFVQDNTLQNISAQCASDPSGHYGDVGIGMGSNVDHIFIVRNTIRSTALDNPACTLPIPWDSPGTGIAWGDATTLVVKDNTLTGGFRDAISSDNPNNFGENIDIIGNTINGYQDDGVESKGGNVNVRIWNNHITVDAGSSCIAGNTQETDNLYGPLYIFRNTCRVTTGNTEGLTVYKLGGVQTYLFHNSSDSSPAAPSPWDTYVGGPLVVLNNIAQSSGTITNYGSGTFDYNIDVQTQPSDSSFAYLWNGTTTYDTFTDFCAGTGQEAHGFARAPLFTDTALHIDATSPAYDTGVVLPNFNSLDSAWPYRGRAPDMGAYEVTGTTP